MSGDAPASGTVGFIGLGNMGRPMAERIAASGRPMRLWARRPASLDGLIGEGRAACSKPRALGAESDIVCLCVRTDAEVLDLVLREPDGILGGMRPGSVLAIHATVHPRTIAQLQAACRDRGVMLIDAPVSGGPSAASSGTLTVILGGEADAIRKALPVMEAFASKLPHVGAAGDAQVLKLINNNLCYANLVNSIAALELARDLGMDPVVAAEVIRTSSGASHAFQLATSEAALTKMSGPSSNVGKDVSHLVELLAERGIADGQLSATSSKALDALRFYVDHAAILTPA